MVAMMCEPLVEQKPGNAAGTLAFAPSVEDILAYGLDGSGRVSAHPELWRSYEQQHGHGSVARLLEQEQYRFGPAGSGYQSRVDVSAINHSGDYLKEIAVRSRNLLRNRVANSSGSDRAHYQALLMQLNTALADKL
ncbi:MAG: hypothetical protein LUD68_07385 [Rikenellaceae bacterium]|nr:hypothetical protein [Rikenellaceae bacterium]